MSVCGSGILIGSIVIGYRSHLRALRTAEEEVGFAIPEVEPGKLTTFGKTVAYMRRKSQNG